MVSYRKGVITYSEAWHGKGFADTSCRRPPPPYGGRAQPAGSVFAPAHRRQAVSGEEAISSAASLRPDICLLDLSMPGIGGVEACRGILETTPECRVIIYSRHDDGRYLLELFHAGIWGYVCKKDSPSRLLEAIDAVRRGEVFMGLPDPDGQRTAILKKMRATKTDDALSSLSPREREILRLIADGTSIRDIAARLCISPKTVESHKYNILTKLRAGSVTDLVKVALRNGLIHV